MDKVLNMLVKVPPELGWIRSDGLLQNLAHGKVMVRREPSGQLKRQNSQAPNVSPKRILVLKDDLRCLN